MKDGTIVRRNGNLFIVKKDKSYHYYLATLMGNVRVTAWHRTPLHKIKEYYEVIIDIKEV